MTNSTFNAGSAFDDLEDEGFWADAPSENIRPFGEPEGPVTDLPVGPQFKERCDRCRGSGKFIGRNGRVLGECFACKDPATGVGRGYKVFKTSGADRAKARLQASTRKENTKQAWADANAAVVAWVQRRATGDRPFEFAVSLAESLAKFGTLTDGQVAAVQKLMAQDAVRQAARIAEANRVKAAAPTVSVEPVIAAFASRKEAAERAAKDKLGGDSERAAFKAILRLGVAGPDPENPKEGAHLFNVSTAKPNSRNPGALYVKRASDGEYLGKLHEGTFQKVFVCTPAEQEAIVQACAEPSKSAIAFGRLTSRCSICGKGLDNYESVQRGIGPKCASKWGF